MKYLFAILKCMEIRKDIAIEWFESFQVSSIWNVRNNRQFYINKTWWQTKIKNKNMVSHKNAKWYPMISLRIYSKWITKRFSTSVHRLVALTLISNPYNKKEVNHINWIRHDNRVENLERCTHSENQIHKRKMWHKMSDYQKERISRAHRKKVNKYSMQWEYICSYESIRAWLIDIGKNPAHQSWIQKSCNNNLLKYCSHWYRWSYA